MPEERDQLQQLFLSWQKARTQKNWIEADKIRDKLMLWDSHSINDQLWHPAFEHNSNRQKRAFERMKKYGIDIYPWSIKT